MGAFRLPSTDQTLPTATSASAWFAGAIIVGTVAFNAGLAFVNGHVFPTGATVVMASEALLLFAAGVACRNYLTMNHVALLGLLVAYALALAATRSIAIPGTPFDPKSARDIVIPVIFFLLGRAVGDIRAADRIVLFVTGLLFVVALLEYLSLSTYLSVFKVAQYYIARGTLEASSHSLNVSEGLMVSGVRPEEQGRTLLPFLGGHRVSSLFLEPSTLGNFGAIVALWGAVRTRMTRQIYFWTILGALALVVLSDTRVAAFLALVGLIVLLLPPRLTTPAVFVLPFATIFALCVFAAWTGPVSGKLEVEGLGLYDRLLYSGRVLMSFDIYHWFGLNVSTAQTFDSGYGYVISNFGIVGFALLWTLFMSLRGRTPYFLAFRNVMGVFFAALLCISASQFTIKLAATLWFLLGVLSVAQEPKLAKRFGTARNPLAPPRQAEGGWLGTPAGTAPELSVINRFRRA